MPVLCLAVKCSEMVERQPPNLLLPTYLLSMLFVLSFQTYCTRKYWGNGRLLQNRLTLFVLLPTNMWYLASTFLVRHLTMVGSDTYDCSGASNETTWAPPCGNISSHVGVVGNQHFVREYETILLVFSIITIGGLYGTTVMFAKAAVVEIKRRVKHMQHVHVLIEKLAYPDGRLVSTYAVLDWMKLRRAVASFGKLVAFAASSERG